MMQSISICNYLYKNKMLNGKLVDVILVSMNKDINWEIWLKLVKIKEILVTW